MRWVCAMAVAAFGCGGGPEIVTGTSGGAATGGGATTGNDTTSGATTGSDGQGSTDSGGTDTGAAETTGADTGGGPGCGGCDDGIACTKDVCKPDGICAHVPVDGPDCAPTLQIDAPPRALTLLQADEVVVQGVAASAVGVTGTLTVNGAPIAADPAGGFEVVLTYPTHGINVITAELEDIIDDRRVVQSFLMGEAFYPTMDGPKPGAQVGHGLEVFVGVDVWDDDDLSDIDDVSTFVHTILKNLDVVPYIPNPITTEGNAPNFGWCEWEVTVDDLTFEVQSVDFSPAVGGFAMTASLTDLVVDFYAAAPGFACPDAGGTASAAAVDVQVFVAVAMKGAVIDVTVEPEDVEVEVGPLVFDITEGAGSAFDFLFNWFSGTITTYLEDAVADAMSEQIAPLVSQLLAKLSGYVQSFDIPPFLGGTDSVTVTVSVSPSTIEIGPKGARVGLSVSVTTPKGPVDLASLGSLKRAGCFGGTEPALDLPTNAPLAMAVHDDVVNQALFAAWWGGVMNVPVDQVIIDALIPELPVAALKVTLDPKLVPVLTSCTQNGKTQVQVGDMRVITQFEFEGETVVVEAFVSAIFEVELAAAAAENATIDIGFGVTEAQTLEFEVISASGAVEGAENLLQLIMESVVENLVIETVSNGVFQSFPIPQLDLGAFIPGLPSDTVLAFYPQALKRDNGYTVLTGTVVQ